MTTTYPQARLDERFSSSNATASSWSDAEQVLADAGVYWVATVRENGKPHVTPVAGVWHQGAFWFSTGPGEQKALNLSRNPRCTVTVGQSDFWNGLDVVLEGVARRASDETTLISLAEAFKSKYDDFFGFTAANGSFTNRVDGTAMVYRVEPTKAFGYARGAAFGQTTWTFA